ncbi:MAG: right-handed parallel beta-helix repeat-containing protein [Opitutaceae bacterium]|jgi:hypothetical protein
MTLKLLLFGSALAAFATTTQAAPDTFSAKQPGQLPGAMHSPMQVVPSVTVGVQTGDFVGSDQRVLQGAVDYVAGLGGGLVIIGPGEFLMRDSLHLRSGVTVRGTPGQTILRKARAAISPLAIDGDYGEEQITVTNPEGFAVGDGVSIWDFNAGGFHTTVARITGQRGNTYSISLPLNSDCMIANGAQTATIFPVVSGYHLEGVKIEDLTIEGTKEENIYLTGCRGAGIFLYRCHGAQIDRCTVRNYAGDGISFQQCNDVIVQSCVSDGNTCLGLHPGSGSQRPIIRKCIARNNGDDGLYLCWRVKEGLFEDNLLEGNARHGISIGHKDTDNLIRRNRVIGNREAGIYFRDETVGMAGHRNRIEENVIESNGLEKTEAGIRVEGETNDLLFKANIIRDTRTGAQHLQNTGIWLGPKVGAVAIEGNQVDATTQIDDQRKK